MYRPRCGPNRIISRTALVLADIGDVLGAALEVKRWLAVAREDLEVDQVDVNRMEPAAGLVLQLPDLDVVEPGVGDHLLKSLAITSSRYGR